MALHEAVRNLGEAATEIIGDGINRGHDDALAGERRDQHAHRQWLAVDEHAVAIKDNQVKMQATPPAGA